MTILGKYAWPALNYRTNSATVPKTTGNRCWPLLNVQDQLGSSVPLTQP